MSCGHSEDMLDEIQMMKSIKRSRCPKCDGYGASGAIEGGRQYMFCYKCDKPYIWEKVQSSASLPNTNQSARAEDPSSSRSQKK